MIIYESKVIIIIVIFHYLLPLLLSLFAQSTDLCHAAFLIIKYSYFLLFIVF
jgi:hypothetical protein